MTTSTGLLDSDVHEVQDEWTGWKDLWGAHQAAERLSKRHLLLLGSAPN